jgi:hypothetical protein
MRFEERRGGESYRPSNRHSRSRSRSRIRRPRSPPRNRSPRMGADTWVPRGGHPSERYRSRSPPGLHRSRSPTYRQPKRERSPLRPRSPRRERPRSPIRSSWRSRSPYVPRPPLEHQSSRGAGDNFRNSHIPRSPRRDRLPSPPRDRPRDAPSPSRPTFKERESYGRPAGRSRSPYRGGRSPPRNDSFMNRRTLSPMKRAPSGYNSAVNSVSTSRRSSPPIANERLRVLSSGRSSRSPTLDTSFRRGTNDDIAKPSLLSNTVSPSSPAHGKPINTLNTTENQASAEVPGRTATDAGRPDSSKSPRSHSDGYFNADRDDGLKDPGSSTSRNSPLSAAPGAASLPSSSSQNRSSNISMLSAPTRPRGSAGYGGREPTWSSSSTPRRAPPPPTPNGPPTGPRNRYVYSPPVHDLHRTPSYRPNSSVSMSHPRNTRTNYLATLPAVVSGGRLLPSTFDFSIEKRLVNLKADEEKLAEQALEKQRLKRLGLQDWDRLQRESALNALRSELAEVHLQRMTEEDRLEGSNAF